MATGIKVNVTRSLVKLRDGMACLVAIVDGDVEAGEKLCGHFVEKGDKALGVKLLVVGAHLSVRGGLGRVHWRRCQRKEKGGGRRVRL